MNSKPFAGPLIALMLLAPLGGRGLQKAASRVRQPQAPAVPSAFRIAGWMPSGKVQVFIGRGLSGHIDGGAEIFLQYGFRDLAVHRFTSSAQKKSDKGKTIILEVYKMTSASDAFGVFSIRRNSAAKVSVSIQALNWIGPAQAAFVKGNVFVDILAIGCAEADIETFAAAVARRINLPPNSGPAQIGRLPKENLIPGSERYIKGDLAAAAESPLLGRDFWGFKGGVTRAFVGSYNPGSSKLIIMNLGRPAGGMAEMVTSLFKEYLGAVRMEAGYVLGENSTGSCFAFAQDNKFAALVLGETDIEVSKARLDEALANSRK